MRVVTSGFGYVDIDAYAGCVAYAELLQLQGIEAVAVSTAPLNESITRTVRSWGAPLKNAYQPTDDDTFVLIDISAPEYFDKIVDLARVDEVIDHHLGLEQYWQERIGDNTHIEFIGAACTQVYERWVAAGLVDKMSQLSARLLMCGILDNTLNFKATVTDERDKIAYEALQAIADLPEDWPAQYFSECQAAILSDAGKAIGNDTKMLHFTKLPLEAVAVGQLAVWDAREVVQKYPAVIQQAMEQTQLPWLVNIISISEGKSNFISDDDAIKKWAELLLSVKFNGSVAEADRLWLRKEIVKQDMALTEG